MDKFFEVREWIRYADNDLEAVSILSAHHPLKMEIICYLCQQSAEKMLKSFLVYSNIKPPKKHEMGDLSEMCKDIDETFADILDICERLNPYANQPRYPFGLEITEDMMRMAINDCEKIKEFVNSKMVLEYCDNE